MTRSRSLLLCVVSVALAAAGCALAGTGGSPPGTRSDGTVGGLILPSLAPGTGLGGGSPVPAGRTGTDRPDDVQGFQVHVIYALSADSTDQQRDLDGSIVRSLQAANTWLAGQTNGAKLRIDTYASAPDVSFYRSPHTHSALGATSGARLANLRTELQATGFVDGQKLYAIYYGGPADPHDDSPGLGGSGWAGIVLNASKSPLAPTATSFGPPEDAFVATTLRALGFVSACAPHVDANGLTTDDPADILSDRVASGTPQLDPGHDDYYKTGSATCLDLAQSPFLDPLPATTQPPANRPLAEGLLAGSVPYQAAITDANSPGVPELEVQLMAAFAAMRASYGLVTLPADAALRLAARHAPVTSDSATWDTLLGQAGFASHAGFTSLTVPSSAAAAVQAFEAQAAVMQLAVDPTLTGAAVGIEVQGGQARVVLAYTHAILQVDGAAIGPGPSGTYTVVFQVHARTAGLASQGRLYLDDKGYLFPFNVTVGADTNVFASVPVGGKHKLYLSFPTAGGVDQADQQFDLDTTRPAASALGFN